MQYKHNILIPKPALFSFDECLWFLNRNYDDCLHRVKPNEIVKAVKYNNEVILFRITDNDAYLQVEILKGKAHQQIESQLIHYISEWFDLSRDLRPFYNVLKADNKLAYMSNDYSGLRLIGIEDLFEALCWSIIGQQINLSFAYKLKRRLVEKYGTKIEYEGDYYYTFPEFEILSQITVDELRVMQFSARKAEYIIGVAQAFSDGVIGKQLIQSLPTMESKLNALTSIRGIGVWTANYSLMKSLREPLCIPHGDIGLLKALTNHNIIKERHEKDKINEFFTRYKGHESYIVFYLWRSLAQNNN